jgi:hypothetical protein
MPGAGPSVVDDAQLTEEPGPSWYARPRVRWIVGYVLAAVVLYACYLLLSRTQPVPSDGASNAFEAWDMLHGNPLLRGWTLTDVSFYTTELPEYMIVELIRGLVPDVVHVAAAFTYTMLVLLASIVAKGTSAGREAVVRVLLASGLMLAPELGLGVRVLLLSPDHVGTGVPLLLMFLVLDRAPRRWYVPPAIGLMLAWAVIGDRLSITIAVAPLVMVCALRTYRGNDPDRWYPACTGAAAIASLGVAALVVHALASHGGFITMPLNTHLPRAAALPRNLGLTAQGVLVLYGADVFGIPVGLQTVIAVVHLAGLALAGWGLCRALRRFFGLGLLEQVLTVAIVLNIAAFLCSSLPDTTWDTRQISAILPFGAVLAARLLAPRLLAPRVLAPRRRLVPSLTSLMALLACYVAALGFGMAQPAVPAHDQDLADWLIAHHLSGGLSVYDEGNITTLASGGRVRLRVVSWQPGGPVPRFYQSKASWFDPATNYANFVVNTTVDGPDSVIPRQEIVTAFGQPARTYVYGPYTIMVWSRNLLAELHGPPSVAPGDVGPPS